VSQKIVRRVPQRYDRGYREQNGYHGAFEADVRAAGMVPEVETDMLKGSAGDEVAAKLGIVPGDPFVMRERVMRADGSTVMVSVSLYPALTDALTEPDTGPGGAMSRLADAGWEPVRFTEHIPYLGRWPWTGTPEELLGVWPVTELIHVGYAADGTVVEHTTCVLPADRWELVYEW
jgi:GntR family transcriptional regulator